MSLIPKKGTVYVVDDDEAVRDSLQWLLEGKDYRVKCFDSSESFLSRFDPREVACLIADIRMDGMSGPYFRTFFCSSMYVSQAKWQLLVYTI